MKRTLTFQLSSLKTTYLYAALIAYGINGLGLLIALVVSTSLGQGIDSLMFNQPVWLFLISIISVPFTLVLMLYAFFDGLMFFDTSLRFGIPRKQYFLSQLPVYILLTLLYVIATAVAEVEWNGSASSYFTTISENYLTIGYVVSQFIRSLFFALLTLAVYRFKIKAFIIGIIAFFLFMTVGPVLAYRSMGDSGLIDVIMNLVQLIVDYREVFVALLVAGMLCIYYLFITKTEVQD